MNPAADSKGIAVVGAGYFAAYHIAGWQAAGAKVLALCDLDASRATTLARRFGVPRVFTDSNAMLNDIQPELVDVVLPPIAQTDVVRSVVGSGLPTICQKPFGIDFASAESMSALAAARRVPLIVHENFRFTPWFRECRRLIDAGLLGRLYGVAFRLRPGDGQGPGAYLDRQPYFQTMPQFLVRETAVHFIDTFRFLMGEVVAVTARLRRLNPAIAGEDAGIIIFEFGDNRSGLFDGNRLNDHTAANPRLTMGEMWLEGEGGVLRLDGDARLWWKPHHGDEIEHVYACDRAAPFGGAVTALQAHVLAHLRGGAPLENAAADYLVNLRVQAAIYQSHETGSRIELAGFNSAH